MTLIFGLAVMLVAIAALYFSLPRGGKTSWFVGTKWEAYLVVAMVGSVGVGLLLVIAGAAPMF
jgi:hypothetical protein